VTTFRTTVIPKLPAPTIPPAMRLAGSDVARVNDQPVRDALDRARELALKDHTEALATYRAIAGRIADGKSTEDDSRELTGIMARLGVTATELEGDVVSVRLARAQQAELDAASAALAAMGPIEGMESALGELNQKLADEIDVLLRPKREALAKLGRARAAEASVTAAKSRLTMTRIDAPRVLG
jgi:hypothetical protein